MLRVLLGISCPSLYLVSLLSFLPSVLAQTGTKSTLLLKIVGISSCGGKRGTFSNSSIVIRLPILLKKNFLSFLSQLTDNITSVLGLEHGD